MKQLIICVVLSTTICVNAFGQRHNASEFSGQVKFDSAPISGTVTVTSTGFGKKKPDAAADATGSAIYVVLFRGIPGSQYELPMIADEAKINNPTVQQLLNGGYGSFITENLIVSEIKQTRKSDGVKGFSDMCKITFNCDALRRHLEKNGVIRKFGI